MHHAPILNETNGHVYQIPTEKSIFLSRELTYRRTSELRNDWSALSTSYKHKALCYHCCKKKKALNLNEVHFPPMKKRHIFKEYGKINSVLYKHRCQIKQFTTVFSFNSHRWRGRTNRCVWNIYN